MPMKQRWVSLSAPGKLQRLGRFVGVALLTMAIATLKSWSYYRYYWHQQVATEQTVDFKLLAHTLPIQLSETLIRNDFQELQRILDRNYGSFGLVVTDCQLITPVCPDQKILFKSNSFSAWKQSLTINNLPEFPYYILYHPPQWDDSISKQTQAQSSTLEEQSKIIGRAYYIRTPPPTFGEDYSAWLQNPLDFQGVRFNYFLTTIVLLFGGVTVWVILEKLLDSKYQQQHRFSLLLQEKDGAIAQLKSLQAQQYSTQIQEIDGLTLTVESIQKELNQMREFEQYVLAENQRLEAQNQTLTHQVNAAKIQIHYLQSLLDELNATLPESYELNTHSTHSSPNIPLSRLTNISSSRAIRALQRLGFTIDRETGDHVILQREVTCSVPRHSEIRPGTLKNIIQRANVTVDEFLDNL